MCVCGGGGGGGGAVICMREERVSESFQSNRRLAKATISLLA